MKRYHFFVRNAGVRFLPAIFAALLLLSMSASVALAGNAPVGGGGSCNQSLASDGSVGQQQAYNNGLYTCLSGNTWAPQSLIIGNALQDGTVPACNSTNNGMLKYTSGGAVQFCNGSSWQSLAASTCDNAPAFFAFTDQNSLGTSSLYSSNIVAVTGMDAGCAATVGVSGSGTPQYRVCSDAACSTVTTNWTASNNSIAMQGQYLQLRATTAATAGTTYTITANIGPVGSNWNITTTPTVCSTGAIGTVCADGSIYAGTSPDGSVPMYVTRCDAGQTWSGSACTGTRQTHAWNSGAANWVNTPLVDCGAPGGCGVSGKTNTATLAVTDSDNVSAGFQVHDAAAYCDSLSIHGQTDWYLPSAPELNVIYANIGAIGNFDTSGTTNYWSSSENGSSTGWYQRFSDGLQGNMTKQFGYLVRCARI